MHRQRCDVTVTDVNILILDEAIVWKHACEVSMHDSLVECQKIKAFDHEIRAERIHLVRVGQLKHPSDAPVTRVLSLKIKQRTCVESWHHSHRLSLITQVQTQKLK